MSRNLPHSYDAADGPALRTDSVLNAQEEIRKEPIDDCLDIIPAPSAPASEARGAHSVRELLKDFFDLSGTLLQKHRCLLAQGAATQTDSTAFGSARRRSTELESGE